MRSAAGEAILIGAGASYEKRESENSFNIVDIDLSTGLGHVQFYKYLSAMNRWIRNRDVNPDDESGAFSFEIQKIRQSNLVSHPETADIEVPKSEDTEFFEDAYEILRRERRPLHYDDISRKLMTIDGNGSNKELADAIHRALLREIEKSESAARKPLIIRVAPGVFMANPSSLVYEFDAQVNKPTGYYRRFPSIGQAYFPFNSNLSIPDGWTVFVKTSDHILAGFGSGIHQLSVQNLKIPPKSYQWSDEYGVGFQGYIQFVRSNTFTVNWGTPQPILVEDPKLGIMPIRGFGDARMQISNIELFLKETVASDTLRIEEMIRTILIQSFSIIVYENLKSFGDLALIYKTSDKMQGLVALEVVKFGIEIKGITIGYVGVHDDFLLQVRQIKKKPVRQSRKEKNHERTARKKPVAKNPKKEK
jgi:hypothetical protein